MSSPLVIYSHSRAIWHHGLHIFPHHDDVIKWKQFFALLAFYAGNSAVNGEFHAQKPVKRSFYVLFDLRLNQQLSKQWRRQWFETPSR